MTIRSAQVEASVITASDGSGKRYVTDIAFDASHGLPFSRRREDALLIRKPGIVDDLARKLHTAWPTMKMSVERCTFREVR